MHTLVPFEKNLSNSQIMRPNRLQRARVWAAGCHGMIAPYVLMSGVQVNVVYSSAHPTLFC